MSSRKNFLDADNSLMERNLRFVKNDLEDNINQYFGGSGGSRSNNTISAPPRDYKVVQPKPGGSHALKLCQDLEERKQFLIQIGLARHEAYNLAKALDFDISYYMDLRNNWLKNGLKEKEVNTRLLYEIKNGDYKCDNYKADHRSGDYHRHESFEHFNDGGRRRYNNISNETKYSNKIMLDVPSEVSTYQNASRYQSEDEIDSGSFKAKLLEESGYYLKSSHLPRSTSPHQGFSSIQPEIEVEHNLRSTPATRSRSPSRNFNHVQQEYTYSADNNGVAGQNNRSLKRSNEIQNERVYKSDRMMGASFQSFSKQRECERECPIYDGFQRHNDKSLIDNMSQEGNGREDFKKVSPSPPTGLHFMQRERSRSRSLDNFHSSHPSRSRSPPSGFNSKSPERSSISNVKRFQLSRMRLNANQCNAMHDRDSSNLCNVNNSNFQQTRLGNQLTKPNVGPSMGDDYTALYKRRRDINDEDFGNAMQLEGFSTNTPSLKGYSSSTTNSKPSEDYWIRADNGTNVPALKRNHNGPSNGYQVLDYGSNSNIPQSCEDVKQFKTIPSLLSLRFNQLPTKDYCIGRGKTTSLTPLMDNNNTTLLYNKPSPGYGIGTGNTTYIQSSTAYKIAPSNNNQSLDNGSNSNIFSYWPQPPTTSENMKNQHDETQRKLTFKEQRKLNSQKAFKEQQKLSKQLKNEKRREYRLEKPISSCPLIPCGFKTPPPGRSKAEPQAYWSEWWPRYKYVEKLLQKKKLSMKPYDIVVPPRKCLLLTIGINKILRNVDLTESDYCYRNTFKLFKYKKQLENYNFQNSLRCSQLKRVRAALARLQNKSTMALLHQSIIYKWHFSLDILKRAQAGELIKFRKAFKLLSDKIFDYYVLESIQQLKAMCKAEWPKFKEFYNSIDTTNDETDISTLIFNTSLIIENNSMATQAYDGNNDAHNEADDDEDNEQDAEGREILMDTEMI